MARAMIAPVIPECSASIACLHGTACAGYSRDRRLVALLEVVIERLDEQVVCGPLVVEGQLAKLAPSGPVEAQRQPFPLFVTVLGSVRLHLRFTVRAADNHKPTRLELRSCNRTIMPSHIQTSVWV